MSDQLFAKNILLYTLSPCFKCDYLWQDRLETFNQTDSPISDGLSIENVLFLLGLSTCPVPCTYGEILITKIWIKVSMPKSRSSQFIGMADPKEPKSCTATSWRGK